MSTLSETSKAYYNATAQEWRDSMKGEAIEHKDRISLLVNAARFKAAEALLPQTGPFRFLDFGCGTGDYAVSLMKEGHSGLGIEPAENMLRLARESAEEAGLPADSFQFGDSQNWPEGSFDIVLALSVLFFLSEEDEAAFFEHCLRSLKPGGRIICSYINKFTDMVSLNEYSLKFFEDRVMPALSDDQARKSQVSRALSELLPGAGGDKSFKNAGITSVVPIRAENPFHLARKFRRFGFEIDDMVFSRFYLLPPEIIEREENLDLFERQIALIERAEDSDLGPVFAKTITARLKPIQ